MIDQRLLDLQTTHCRLRPIARSDVPFIYDIRRRTVDQFLQPIPDGVEHQYRYFDAYRERFEAGDEIYYIIRDLRQDQDVGVVRLTDIRSTDWYNWHSLIVRPTATPQVGIDICILFYAIGFDILGKRVCGPWPVRRNFIKMIRIHELMRMAKPVREDAEYFFYQVNEADYREHAPRLRRLSFGVIGGLHDD